MGAAAAPGACGTKVCLHAVLVKVMGGYVLCTQTRRGNIPERHGCSCCCHPSCLLHPMVPVLFLLCCLRKGDQPHVEHSLAAPAHFVVPV